MNSEAGMNCTLTQTFIKDNQLSLVVIVQIASSLSYFVEITEILSPIRI
jgi:hypothetical protein